MIVLLLIPLAVALIAMPIVKRAPIHGALLAGWAALTFLGFAPGGVLASAGFADISLVAALPVLLVSLNGFAVSFMMIVRLSRLYRGDPLGSSHFLVGHHAAVVIAFFVADLIAGRGFYFTGFCLVACGVGALIVSHDKAKRPYAHQPCPVAF